MKKYLAIPMLAISLATTIGCTSETSFGPCIGAFDERDPKLTYKLSWWNAFLALFFVSSIGVPVVVVANESFCPVGVRGQRAQ